MAKFKQMPVEPTQILMFPVSIDESIPVDADVRMLSDAMDILDWSNLEASYAETGCPTPLFYRCPLIYRIWVEIYKYYHIRSLGIGRCLVW